MPANYTPEEAARIEVLDAEIEAARRSIAPAKKERRQIMLRAYQRAFRAKDTFGPYQDKGE